MNRSNATAALIALLVATNAFTVVKVLRVASNANRTAQVLATSQRNQLANRTENVGTWCNAINQNRAYNRLFVARSQASLPPRERLAYSLGDLDCKQLELMTLQSSHPK